MTQSADHLLTTAYWLVEDVVMKGVPAKRAYRSDGASVTPYMMPSGKIRYTPVKPNGGCLVTGSGGTARFATLALAQKALGPAKERKG